MEWLANWDRTAPSKRPVRKRCFMRSRSPAWVAGRTQHKATGRLSGYGDAGHARAGRDMLVTRPWDIQVSDSKPGYSPRVPRGPRGHVVSGVSLGCRTSLATADTSRRSGSLAFADGSESRDFTVCRVTGRQNPGSHFSLRSTQPSISPSHCIVSAVSRSRSFTACRAPRSTSPTP